MTGSRSFRCLQFTVLLLGLFATGLSGSALCGGSGTSGMPTAINAIMQKPRYAKADWALRVVDLKSGAVIYDLNSHENLLTGSVRKLYSAGVALNKFGADYRFKTPVFRHGEVDASGNLNGDLILVAKGDLTMGGRANGNDTVADLHEWPKDLSAVTLKAAVCGRHPSNRHSGDARAESGEEPSRGAHLQRRTPARCNRFPLGS
jgi:D-alanyl-D-alanine carboxypeptidase